jgi:hypothetical protein
LEDRHAPASISFVGGNLTLTGDSTHTNISVLATADNTLKVTGLGALPSTFLVTGNLVINGSNTSDNVTVDLAGFKFGRNVTVATRNNLAAAPDSVTVKAGTVQRRLAVTTGNGNDNVTLTGLTVQGQVASFFGGVGSDNFSMDSASSVAGITVIASFNVVNLNGSTRQAVVSSADEGIGSNVTLGSTGTANALTVVGGSGPDNLTIAGSVFGSVVNSAGSGVSNLVLNGTAHVGGSLRNYTGNLADLVQFDAGAFVAGDVRLYQGDGNNNYALSGKSFVNGSFTLNAGNGSDNVGAFGVNVSGNAYFNLGNGANTLNYTGTLSGSQWNYTGGGGVDNVTLSTATSANFRGNFGAGDDVFTYAAGSALGSFQATGATRVSS